MNKALAISWIGSILLSAFLGGYIVYQYYNKPIPDPAEPIVTPVVSNPIVRPEDLSCEKAKNLLWCYDNDPFRIDWTIIKQTKKEMNVNISGGLCERKFEQTATLSIIQSSSGNWKFALGFCAGTAVVLGTGYIILKIFK